MVTVARQASGSDSRLSLITALTRSQGQSEAANSEPEPRSESKRHVSHGHDHSDGQARVQAPSPRHSDPARGPNASGPTEVQVLIMTWGC